MSQIRLIDNILSYDIRMVNLIISLLLAYVIS